MQPLLSGSDGCFDTHLLLSCHRAAACPGYEECLRAAHAGFPPTPGVQHAQPKERPPREPALHCLFGKGTADLGYPLLCDRQLPALVGGISVKVRASEAFPSLSSYGGFGGWGATFQFTVTMPGLQALISAQQQQVWDGNLVVQ